MIFQQTDQSDRSILLEDGEESRYSKTRCSSAAGDLTVSTLWPVDGGNRSPVESASCSLEKSTHDPDVLPSPCKG